MTVTTITLTRAAGLSAVAAVIGIVAQGIRRRISAGYD